MRSIKFNLSKKTASGWDAAVVLMEAYLSNQCKADQLLKQIDGYLKADCRSSCQYFFLGALRNGHRVLATLDNLLQKKSKPLVEAILLVTAHELIDSKNERHPKIVHHAVERSKALVNRYDQGFLNAVLRKLPKALELTNEANSPSAYHSHPEWLVDNWRKQFPKNHLNLLRWNQCVPINYIKIYDSKIKLSSNFVETQWPNYYKVSNQTCWKNDIHPLLNQGNAYIKDPSTRIAAILLDPKPRECVLDLCAAPGGKAFDMAHAMNGHGQIVSVDMPGKRISLLKENLNSLQMPELKTSILEFDILRLTPDVFIERNLPFQYKTIMLDAPCSNTGVIQRRPDVKWRLKPKDIKYCTKLQSAMLKAAAKLVKTGGRIVYSTCSIEVCENQKVIDSFLASDSGNQFQLKDKIISLPWETGHDGASAFLLERSKDNKN